MIMAYQQYRSLITQPKVRNGKAGKSFSNLPDLFGGKMAYPLAISATLAAQGATLSLFETNSFFKRVTFLYRDQKL
jgi:hypothetical protein